jgi:hypothetical protein
MTPQEAKKMLKAKLECLKNETSGINYDCNMRLCDGCSLNYEQGNMGEQKEALDMAIKALEQTETLNRIITQIEQARDKDKLCEYPYNRCIKIIEEHRPGNSLVSVPAPKRKAAIERQVIVTWFTPEEKLPEEDIGVLATVTARVKNREFIRAILTVFYCKSEGWYELDYGFSELTVHAWCDLEPYEGD